MKKKLITVLIQILIFSVILLIGGSFYSNTMASYDVNPHATTGITASQHPSLNNMDVNYFWMEIITLNNTMYLTFDFRYFSNGTHAVSFTLPYRVLQLDNLKEEGNWLFNNSESGSIVTVFCHINESLPYDVGNKNFRTKLYLEDSVVDKIFETRSVTLSFGGSMTVDINEVRQEIQKALPFGLVGNGYDGMLYIAIPKSAIITATTVPISRIGSEKDYKVLEFQINEFKPFQLQYVDPEARRDFEINLLFSGIFIGAAVSGFVGVFIDNFKHLLIRKNLKSA